MHIYPIKYKYDIFQIYHVCFNKSLYSENTLAVITFPSNHGFIVHQNWGALVVLNVGLQNALNMWMSQSGNDILRKVSFTNLLVFQIFKCMTNNIAESHARCFTQKKVWIKQFGIYV